MAVAANEHHRQPNYRAGDKVLISTEKLPISYANIARSSRKLQHQFAGLFSLVRQYGDNTFEIPNFPLDWRLHNVNVDRFKQYTADPMRPALPPPPLRSNIVLRQRVGRGRDFKPLRTHYEGSRIPGIFWGI
jgi:hypothetical protein